MISTRLRHATLLLVLASMLGVAVSMWVPQASMGAGGRGLPEHRVPGPDKGRGGAEPSLSRAALPDCSSPPPLRAAALPETDAVAKRANVTSTVHGVVLWRDNRLPVPGAKVHLCGCYSGESPAEHQEGRTDGAGRFRFENVGPGERRIHLYAPGAGNIQVLESLQVWIGIPPEPKVILLDRGACVEGFVTTESGDPVSDARVEFTWLPRGDSWYERLDLATDASGRIILPYMLCLREGAQDEERASLAYKLMIWAEGYYVHRESDLHLDPDLRNLLRVELRRSPPPARIRGAVVDEFGRRQRGELVQIRTRFGADGGWLWGADCRTNDLGEYELEISGTSLLDPTGRPCVAAAIRAGGEYSNIMTGEEWEESIWTSVPVLVEPGEEIAGFEIVLDPRKRRFILDYDVEVAAEDFPADEQGRFEFPHVRDVDYELEAKAPGFLPSPTALSVHGGDLTVRVVLEPQGAPKPGKRRVSPDDPGSPR